ncbi:2-amino-4-hydroxy-6-hydroxymethyldihydropteridine diphosphokinase [Corynebacterium simulans]|uniref:2-amino-4-hydroxy-6- hydroxymethyldihydropteridine diphosphokinase n=1 Tax=Corynebacterium TaxID=1716 RepID=UPI000785975A|nr:MULTISPECIES: 2-amino-4-hydroxy-6-hydroxymethyldihydropteridine diphosphokinase [Corynebacterium]AMO89478.1 2-amino-4-hydroxy-6-hydroxymethyldihydropteridine diphosphokinase [Corynebacterium simulans]MCK6161359.1 2-amino-4-hydroxy-6-hydroxymethyldihydropteridine diphosphokinase [Corynebacterium simulans]OFR40101.1 2-amino-4-hydroxy-6-hydroxymethyldihydropteridine diphosphokinase [Corynebacterium sp. HMSC077D03]
MRAVLSIGSNMDDRRALLQTVFDEFAAETVAASPIYSTPPWGVTDQDEFLNAVLIVDVEESPLELLRRGQALEQAAERVRVRHWGPRTLDVDIVQVEGVTSSDPELTLPHPYAHERAFVLVPWLAADPDARLGDTPVADLIAALDPAEVEQVKLA